MTDGQTEAHEGSPIRPWPGGKRPPDPPLRSYDEWIHDCDYFGTDDAHVVIVWLFGGVCGLSGTLIGIAIGWYLWG